jgi:hypothetical protein
VSCSLKSQEDQTAAISAAAFGWEGRHPSWDLARRLLMRWSSAKASAIGPIWSRAMGQRLTFGEGHPKHRLVPPVSPRIWLTEGVS